MTMQPGSPLWSRFCWNRQVMKSDRLRSNVLWDGNEQNQKHKEVAWAGSPDPFVTHHSYTSAYPNLSHVAKGGSHVTSWRRRERKSKLDLWQVSLSRTSYPAIVVLWLTEDVKSETENFLTEHNSSSQSFSIWGFLFVCFAAVTWVPVPTKWCKEC